MLSFLEAIRPELERVNTTIIQRLHSEEALVEEIGHHLVNAGGKRLRPVLVLLSAKALGYQGDQHIELAAIIEFIHTATLLHDDVVDVSQLRRGLPTANAQWGNAPSVLVGDFLYSRAFQMMVEIGSMDVMNIMSTTTNVIAEGEVQQLANAQNPNIEERNYLDVIYKKTAALFEAACECGATISGADHAYRRKFKAFGYHLGIAFQLMDDLLDYEGDSDMLGKNVGDDLAEGKATLPVIHAIGVSTGEQATLLKKSIEHADASELTHIIDLVRASGSLDYTRQMALEHAEKAIAILEPLPTSTWRECLIDLTRFSVERSY